MFATTRSFSYKLYQKKSAVLINCNRESVICKLDLVELFLLNS